MISHWQPEASTGSTCLEERLAQLESALQEREKILARVTADLVRAEESEGKRIALEIHDGPAQALVNLYNGIQLCELLVERNVEEAKSQLAHLKQVGRAAIKEARGLIHELRPFALDESGLLPTLTRYLQDFETHTGIHCSLQVAQSRLRLGPTAELVVYKIVREALANARKHSGAGHVCISLRRKEKHVVVSISDNGCGFDPSAALAYSARRGTFGLAGMRERTDLLGGSIDIRSATGKGTTIIVRVPYQESQE